MYWKQFCYQILFILLVLFIPSLVWASQQTPPVVQNYAPNLWFSSGEKYYPVNPLDFYFELEKEIAGEKAVNKYNQLALKEKASQIKVLYHILDYEDEWVYQYWFFYVFNDYQKGVRNEHYGDWEAIYVYVDKASKEINKVIGTAHQRKIFDTELNNLKTKHIWSYIGNGSHANCIDDKEDGECNFFRWKAWESWDKNGLKINYQKYKLIEINGYFIKQFNQLETLAKSSELGINLAKFSNFLNKNIYLPLGGSPPTYAWEQSSFYYPNQIRPISRDLIKEYAINKYQETKTAIKKTGKQIAGFFNNLITKTTRFFDQNNSFQTAGINPIIQNQVSLTQDNFNQPEQKDQPKQTNLLPKTNTKPKNKFKKTNQTEPKTEKNQIQKQNSVSKQIIKKEESDKENQKQKQKQGEIIKKEFKIKKINLLPPGAGCNPNNSQNQENNSQENNKVIEQKLNTPKIVSPDNKGLFNQKEITLIGTAEPNLTILIFINSTSSPADYTTTSDENGDWQKDISLVEGNNLISVKAEKNTQASDFDSIQIEIDLSAPLKINDLTAEYGTERGSIDLNWRSPGGNEYILKYASSSDVWDKGIQIANSLAPKTASSSQSFSVNNLKINQTYYFALKTEDKAGNISEISNIASSSPSALADYVIINEVQLADNEFIELYNPTDTDIDMSNWYFAYYPSDYDWDDDPWRNKPFSEADSAIIPAQGYYLVGLKGYPELNGYVDSDWQIYSSNQLSGSAGSIAIFPWDPSIKTALQARNGAIDVLGWGGANFVFESNQAIASARNKSLVRKISGWDKNNNLVDFKESDWPMPENSAGDKAGIIDDEFVFNQDAIWKTEDKKYILESNASAYPTVENGANLTIQPGVSIYGVSPDYPSLVIKGSLQAQGSSEEPIIFQGFNQNLFASSWSGIVFDNASASLIDHAEFIKAGTQAAYNGYISEAIRIINSQVTIKNSSFNQIQNNAIWSENSVLEIQNSSFQDVGSSGIGIKGGSLEISDSVFDSLGDMGVALFDQATAQINHNQFIDSTWPVYLKSSYPEFINNQALNNQLDGIVIDSGSVFSQDWTWNNDLPYILYSNKGDYPTVATSTVLTLEPGTIVQAKNKSYTALLIQGELRAVGTAKDPILFQPYADEWKNIVFEAGSIGEIDYAEFDSADNPAIEINANANVNLGGNVSYK